jgi:hypothetical protein
MYTIHACSRKLTSHMNWKFFSEYPKWLIYSSFALVDELQRNGFSSLFQKFCKNVLDNIRNKIPFSLKPLFNRMIHLLCVS